MYAAGQGSTDVAKILLQHGSDFKTRNNWG